MPRKTVGEDTPATLNVETPSPEKLLPVRAILGFADGNLREELQKYGYPIEWRPNEVRRLPKWLILRCLFSGAELETESGDPLEAPGLEHG